MQYEIENARHVDCQRRAARRRVVAEAEKFASGTMPSAALLGSILDYLRWRVIHATFVIHGAYLEAMRAVASNR